MAVRADPISAFGGIVAFNCTVDADMAREIREFRLSDGWLPRVCFMKSSSPRLTLPKVWKC